MERKKQEVNHLDIEDLREELCRMAKVDVRTVDKDTLVDIENVTIDTSLPEKERIEDFLRQVKNPYCYCCHGMIVKLSFSGKKTLEECLAHCFSLDM